MEVSPGKYKFALAADIRYNNDRNNDFQLRYTFVVDTSGLILSVEGDYIITVTSYWAR